MDEWMLVLFQKATQIPRFGASGRFSNPRNFPPQIPLHNVTSNRLPRYILTKVPYLPSYIFNVASSFLSDSYALATDQLQSLYTALPPNLRSYLTSALDLIQPLQAQQQPLTLVEKATNFCSTNPYSIFVSAVVPVVLLLYALMSWWPNSGRYSPFTSFYNRGGPPQVTEEDYSYISGESEPVRHNSYGFPSANNTTYHHGGGAHYRHGSSSNHPPADIAPDQIILRHKGTGYPLHFAPFSISEGDLRVRDLRNKAAKELHVEDPRRVKLLYKGKQMRDNKASCKHENLKQNSEVMCVVSSEPTRSSSESEGSDSGQTGLDDLRDEERKKKRKNHRGGKKKVRHTNEEPATIPPANLAPPTDARPATSRTPSPGPKKPTTPAEMLADIEYTFDTEYAPKARDYLAHPPPDAKSREFEYKKLSETILAQVLIKLDGVETMGDEVLRGKRKELVNKIQGVLTELDRVGKPKA